MMTITELNAAIAKAKGWTGSDGLWCPYSPCRIGDMRENPTDDPEECWEMLTALLKHRGVRFEGTDSFEEAVCRAWLDVFGSKE